MTSGVSPAPIRTELLDAVVAPFGTSTGLPATAYTGVDVFAWERTRFFSGSWFCVGRTDEILEPGSARAIDICGEGVLLTRDPQGVVAAFTNTCRHRGHELLPQGPAVPAKRIRCPYHSWTYGLDGSLRTAPDFAKNDTFVAADLGLNRVVAAAWAGWLFVNVDGAAGPLTEYLGNAIDFLEPYAPHRLVSGARSRYEVAANWKIIIENYSECYHCSAIHPALCEITPPGSGADVTPTGIWCGGTMDLKEHAATMSMDGTSPLLPLPDLDDRGRRTVFYAAIFPNLLVSAHPDYVLTHRLTPLSPDRTIVECDWLFEPEAVSTAGFDASFAVDFWDLTNRQDWSACEGVQRGVANAGYRPGPIGRREATTYQFLTMVARAYTGAALTPSRVESRTR